MIKNILFDLINSRKTLKRVDLTFFKSSRTFFSFTLICMRYLEWQISHITFFFSSHCRFQIDKRCQHRCSWKCFSIALILLSIVLATMVAYFASKSLVIFLLLLEYPCHVQILLKWKWEFFHHFEAFFFKWKTFSWVIFIHRERHTQKKGEVKVKSFTIVKLLEWWEQNEINLTIVTQICQ